MLLWLFSVVTGAGKRLSGADLIQTMVEEHASILVRCWICLSLSSCLGSFSNRLSRFVELLYSGIFDKEALIYSVECLFNKELELGHPHYEVRNTTINDDNRRTRPLKLKITMELTTRKKQGVSTVKA